MENNEGGRALITGVSGQDGSYLSELLLKYGYTVFGMIRRSSSPNKWRIEHLKNNPRFVLISGDMTDSSSIDNAVARSMPNEIYNLAAQSDVWESFSTPVQTMNVNAAGTVRILESMRRFCPNARFYQASTSEMFGRNYGIVNEHTMFYPRSPYGVAKLAAHWAAVNYREAYNMHICSGILFNHESPHRGPSFVSRKIASGVAEIAVGKRDYISLGNINACRDWGYAPEYVRAMYRMLQHDHPEDFIIATGQKHSVREFVETAAQCIDTEITWSGKGENETGDARICGKKKTIVRIDPKFYRPADVDSLCGDSSRARHVLNWTPKTSFKRLVEIMVRHEMDKL